MTLFGIDQGPDWSWAGVVLSGLVISGLVLVLMDGLLATVDGPRPIRDWLHELGQRANIWLDRRVNTETEYHPAHRRAYEMYAATYYGIRLRRPHPYDWERDGDGWPEGT